MITAYISDRYQMRGIVAIFNNFVMLIGFISMAGSPGILVLANKCDQLCVKVSQTKSDI